MIMYAGPTHDSFVQSFYSSFTPKLSVLRTTPEHSLPHFLVAEEDVAVVYEMKDPSGTLHKDGLT